MLQLLLSTALAAEAPAPSDRPELDLTVGVGFSSPSERPVLGAMVAFVSWAGVDGLFNVRFYENGPLVLSAGVQGFYSRSLLLEAVGEWLLTSLDTSGGTWDITPTHFGMAGRLTAGLNAQGRVQPYGLFTVGTDRLNLAIEYTGDGGSGEASYGETAVRFGGGIGVDFVLGEGKWLLQPEYRYVAARSFKTDSTVTVVGGDGEPLVEWTQEKWQSPPRGSAWGLRFGKRF